MTLMSYSSEYRMFVPRL